MRKVVGVIGGMGPLATEAFFRELNRQTVAARDQDYVHVIIDSDPTIPDRTAFLMGEGPDPRSRILAAARRLQNAGCHLLVMPCNTAHAFVEDIRRSITVPFYDLVELAVDAMATSFPAPVGILATRGTLHARLYERALEARGVASLTPEPDAIDELMDVVYGVNGAKTGSFGDGAHRLVRVADRLVERGARSLVLGCTELALVLPAADARWPVPPLDPTPVVAATVVRRAGGVTR